MKCGCQGHDKWSTGNTLKNTGKLSKSLLSRCELLERNFQQSGQWCFGQCVLSNFVQGVCVRSCVEVSDSFGLVISASRCVLHCGEFLFLVLVCFL